jgi:hypothetical protein
MQRRPHQAGLAMDTPKGIDGMRPPRRAASTPHVQSANRAAPTGNFGNPGVSAAKILVYWTSCLPHNCDLSWWRITADPKAEDGRPELGGIKPGNLFWPASGNIVGGGCECKHIKHVLVFSGHAKGTSHRFRDGVKTVDWPRLG